MPRFNLQRFLAETGLSIAKLASYLQVALPYLQQAAAGKAELTRRDREACRRLWRRLTQAVQIELPFAEPLETFTREHVLRLARARASASAAPAGRTPRGSRQGSRKPIPDRKTPPKDWRGRGARGPAPTKKHPSSGESGATPARLRRKHPLDRRTHP